MNISKILLFVLINLLGFLSVNICYYIGMWSGVISLNHPGFDPVTFRTHFLAGTLITWLVCAVFSVAYFFIRGKERLLFLWAPLAIPMAYGLSVLFGFLSL